MTTTPATFLTTTDPLSPVSRTKRAFLAIRTKLGFLPFNKPTAHRPTDTACLSDHIPSTVPSSSMQLPHSAPCSPRSKAEAILGVRLPLRYHHGQILLYRRRMSPTESLSFIPNRLKPDSAPRAPSLEWFYSQANPSLTISPQPSPTSSVSLLSDSDDADISSGSSSDVREEEPCSPPLKLPKTATFVPSRRSPSSYSDSAYSSVFGEDFPGKLRQPSRGEEPPLPELKETSSMEVVKTTESQESLENDTSRPSHESKASTVYFTPPTSPLPVSFENIAATSQSYVLHSTLKSSTPRRSHTYSTLPFPKHTSPIEDERQHATPLLPRIKDFALQDALPGPAPNAPLDSSDSAPIEESDEDWESLEASLRRARERRAQRSVRSATRERIWRTSGLSGVLEDAGRGGMQVELGFAARVRLTTR